MVDSSKIDKFWNFFISNKSEFENINENNIDEKLDLLLENLKIVVTGLAIEISNEFNGFRELIISPEGDKEKFEIVEAIVRSAPKIEGWVFIAFRQPVEGDFTLKYKDLEYTPSKMFFHPIIDQNDLDLKIYINNAKSYKKETVEYYGLIAMDNVLGEYDCVTKVRYYDFLDIDEAKDSDKLKPLSELRLFVKKFHDKKLN